MNPTTRFWLGFCLYLTVAAAVFFLAWWFTHRPWDD
jgi:hypothetical protein